MSGETLDDKISSLKDKLAIFYTKYLLTINIQNTDILDAIQCLQYKAVTHLVFFRIVNFINMLTSIKMLKIKKCIFMFNQEIIYSSVNPMDSFLINEYLSVILFPKFFQLQSQQNYDLDKNGSFVKEQDDKTLENAPRVYLYNEDKHGECETYRMVVYNIVDVSLVMFVEGNLQFQN
jgi:Intu longin-like domain 2